MRENRRSHSTKLGFIRSGVPSTPAACGRHPLQAGEGGGFLRRGRGGTGSGPCTVPHPSRLRRSTLSQERVGPLIRQGLWPCHRPRRGRLPPAGERRYRVGHLYRPTPVPASPVHPLPGEGLFPHPSGLRPATLSQERVFICPRGSLRIRACLCSGLLPSLPGGLPAPRRPWPPAHTPRGKRKWGRSSRSGSLRPGGCHRSA